MRAAYGLDDIGKNRSIIQVAAKYVREFGEAITPGKFLVNTFPILKHIPAWLPGAGFQTYFAGLAKLSVKAVYTPFEDTKKNVVCSIPLSRSDLDSHFARQMGKKERTLALRHP